MEGNKREGKEEENTFLCKWLKQFNESMYQYLQTSSSNWGTGMQLRIFLIMKNWT